MNLSDRRQYIEYYIHWAMCYRDLIWVFMRIIIFIALFFVLTTCKASDCFGVAGRRYNIDPDLLRAIGEVESNSQSNAIGLNQKYGYGVGRMQIDSNNFNQLNHFGITPQELLRNDCLNIYVGAYYLSIAFKKWGVSWESVGAYNAGFKQSQKQKIRRFIYSTKVKRVYEKIKNDVPGNSH